MFSTSHRLNQLTISMATPAHHPLVLKLVHNARFRLIQFGRTTLSMPTTHLRMAVAWYQTQPVATLIATTTAAHSAWIRCCAIEGIHLNDHDAVLAQLARCLVNESGVTMLYYSSDHYDRWLADILQGVGFTPQGGIISLERPLHHAHDMSPIVPIADLQPLRISDIPHMQAIDHEVFHEHWHKIPYEVQDLFHDEHYGVLAMCNHHAVGYALAAIHDQRTSLHLVRIAVHPQWQGRGIATQLLGDIVAHAQRIAVLRVTLNTQADNHIAQHLYNQFGFITTGDRYDIYAMHTTT